MNKIARKVIKLVEKKKIEKGRSEEKLSLDNKPNRKEIKEKVISEEEKEES